MYFSKLLKSLHKWQIRPSAPTTHFLKKFQLFTGIAFPNVRRYTDFVHDWTLHEVKLIDNFVIFRNTESSDLAMVACLPIVYLFQTTECITMLYYSHHARYAHLGAKNGGL